MIGRDKKRQRESEATPKLSVQRQKQSKLLPKTFLGANDFEDLVEESTVIVDKSLLIKKYLEDSDNVVLVTYPRRWGKTTNIKMIEKFLELEVDSKGQILPDNQKKNQVLFSEGIITKTGKKQPLAIWYEEEIVRKNFGKYPVISISFKSVRGDDFDQLFDKIKYKIVGLFKEHRYLLSATLIPEDELKIFKQYINNENINQTSIEFSLSFLCDLLKKHFNQKVFVLIDEYDTPINHALMKFASSEGQRVLDLFRGLLGEVLKDNDNLKKGFVTGILRIAKASLFSDINHLQEYSMLNPKYAAYYGFNASEVDELVEKYGVDQDTANAIKEWYNGYKVGDLEIYNPWSVLNSLKSYTDQGPVLTDYSNILRSYWEESGTISFVDSLFAKPRIKKVLISIADDHNLSLGCKIYEQFSLRDFKILQKLITYGSNYEVKDIAINLLLSYLLMAGYFTLTENKQKLKLPNKEIKNELKNKLVDFYSTKYSLDSQLFDQVTDKLQLLLDQQNSNEFEKHITDFEEVFTKLLFELPELKKLTEKNIASLDKKVLHANEDLIHSLLNYIILRIHTIDKFASEVYLGEGRADIVFTDKVNNKGIIIELKYQGDAKAALEQIKEQQYARSLFAEFDTLLIGLNVDAEKAVTSCHEIHLIGQEQEDNLY